MLQRHLKYDINTASFDRGTQCWWQGILYSGGWISSATVCAVTKAPPAQNEGPQRNKVLIKIALSLMQEVVWAVGHQQDTP